MRLIVCWAVIVLVLAGGFLAGDVVASSCTDSDGGKSYYVKGTAKDGKNTYVDSCDSSKKLSEGYCCSETHTAQKESYTCPHGCKDGVCVNQTAQCTDSDGGENYYKYGVVKDSSGQYFEDACYSESPLEKTLNEKYCDWDGRVALRRYDCPYLCRNGACVNKTTSKSCTDSDGGLKYDVKGETKDDLKTHTDYCSEAGTHVYEGYCENNFVRTHYQSCTYGCKDGACVSKTTTTTTTTTRTTTTRTTTTRTTTTRTSTTTVTTTTQTTTTLPTAGIQGESLLLKIIRLIRSLLRLN